MEVASSAWTQEVPNKIVKHDIICGSKIQPLIDGPRASLFPRVPRSSGSSGCSPLLGISSCSPRDDDNNNLVFVGLMVV